MAWYGVNYACGHHDRMQVYGPTKDRQRIADAEGRKDCPDCWRVKRDQRNAEAALAASADAAANGLPELIGSPKQIAWAETIRQKMLADLAPVTLSKRAQLVLLEQGGVSLADQRWTQIAEATDTQIATYRAQASAKWWIDHHDDSLSRLCIDKMAELAKALFAVEIQQHRDRLAFASADKQAVRDAEAAAANAARETEHAVSETAAAQFVPVRVERLNGRDVRITGEDNHVAMAYRDDGETVVYLIDDIHICSTLPKAEALNRRIHALVPDR